MIVRILGEGQFGLSDEAVPTLNELDAALETAVVGGDEAAFAAALSALLDAVRTQGTPLPVDILDESDAILPPADASIAEVQELLSDDGLIPG
jgi:hypothetical protein